MENNDSHPTGVIHLLSPAPDHRHRIAGERMVDRDPAKLQTGRYRGDAVGLASEFSSVGLLDSQHDRPGGTGQPRETREADRRRQILFRGVDDLEDDLARLTRPRVADGVQIDLQRRRLSRRARACRRGST